MLLPSAADPAKYHELLLLLHRSDGSYIEIAGPTYCLLALLSFCTDYWKVTRHCRPCASPTSSRPNRNITARSTSCTDQSGITLKNCGAHLLLTSPHVLLHRSLKSTSGPALLPPAANPTEISRLAHTPAQISWELKNCGAHLLPLLAS